MGPGRQTWGCETGPDCRRLEKVRFYVLGQREPLQAFSFQASLSLLKKIHWVAVWSGGNTESSS